MGYGYGWTASGRQALACDNCGASEGATRKRPCPHKVLFSSHRATGRYSLPYCYPPALCPDCYKSLGGLRGVHGESCREGAAAVQATEDATEAALEAGEFLVTSASGSWKEGVPDGMVEVTFSGRAGERVALIPEHMYSTGNTLTLSQYEAMMKEVPA